MDITRRRFLAAGVGGLALAGTAAAGPARAVSAAGPARAVSAAAPTRAEILATVQAVNDHWIGANTDPGDNKWARATYFSGLTTLYRTTGAARYLAYAQAWAEKWNYGLNPGPAITRANDQCAGQAYFDLYDIAPDPHKIAAVVAAVAADRTGPVDSWWWVDAQFMAMPTWTRVATKQKDSRVLSAMWARYSNARSTRGLWNSANGLWFRDSTFVPPSGTTTPSGGPMFWSRGNGWAMAALARTLKARPDLATTWPKYPSTLQAMAAALRTTQRADGFWNVDLRDPTDYPGPETSGTSMFVYALATGITLGRLSRSIYLPVATAAWNGLATTAVQPDGSLGYVQGVGKQPSSSQPVTAATTADFGVGAFTSAGCALAALVS